MALAACRECGAQVSDSAPSCPNCGVPNPVPSETWVIVRRQSKLNAALVTYGLSIDGSDDVIKNGKSVEKRMLPGNHQIIVDVPGTGGKVLRADFDISPGQTVEFDLGFSAWSGVKLTRVR